MHRRPGPTFLIAGAPRSGTTWLYHLLDRHPDVYMAKPARPEPKFFLVDELYARGLRHYVDTWFAGAETYVAAGEKSTNYLESATAAERIGRDLPGVQLVFILRDPTDRAHFLHARYAGDDGQEDDGRDDHLHQFDKGVAQRLKRDADLGDLEFAGLISLPGHSRSMVGV